MFLQMSIKQRKFIDIIFIICNIYTVGHILFFPFTLLVEYKEHAYPIVC